MNIILSSSIHFLIRFHVFFGTTSCFLDFCLRIYVIHAFCLKNEEKKKKLCSCSMGREILSTQSARGPTTGAQARRSQQGPRFLSYSKPSSPSVSSKNPCFISAAPPSLVRSTTLLLPKQHAHRAPRSPSRIPRGQVSHASPDPPVSRPRSALAFCS